MPRVGATGNLDSSCARRRERSADRDEETGRSDRTKKLTKKNAAPCQISLTKKVPAPCQISLTKKVPYKAVTRVSAPRGTGKWYVVKVNCDEGVGAARLAAILAGESPANRGVQSLL